MQCTPSSPSYRTPPFERSRFPGDALVSGCSGAPDASTRRHIRSKADAFLRTLSFRPRSSLLSPTYSLLSGGEPLEQADSSSLSFTRSAAAQLLLRPLHRFDWARSNPPRAGNSPVGRPAFCRSLRAALQAHMLVVPPTRRCISSSRYTLNAIACLPKLKLSSRRWQPACFRHRPHHLTWFEH